MNLFSIKKLSVLFCLLFMTESITLMAQTDSLAIFPSVWDLQTCLDYAKQNNISIKNMRLNADIASLDLSQSKAAKYPNLSGTASQDLTHLSSGTSTATSIGVSSSMILYQGGYLNQDIKSKEISMQAANLDVLAAENDITLQITQAFLNILLAKENIKYYQDLVQMTSSQVTQGEQKFKAGTIAKKDLLELQATMANDNYSLVLAKNTERQNKITLKQILQLPSNLDFDIKQTDSLNTSPSLTPLSDAQQMAMNQRPEIKSGGLEIQLQQSELLKAKSTLKPTLSLGGGLGTNYSKNGTESYFPQFNSNFYQQLGLSLSVPILDRKQTKINTQKAKIAVDQARLSLENTKTTLNQNIEQAYIQMENAQQQFNAADQQLIYSEEAFRIADKELKVGGFNLVDYLQQKNLYIQTEQSYIQAKYSAALYTKIYNFYMGIPVTQ